MRGIRVDYVTILANCDDLLALPAKYPMDQGCWLLTGTISPVM